MYFGEIVTLSKATKTGEAVVTGEGRIDQKSRWYEMAMGEMVVDLLMLETYAKAFIHTDEFFTVPPERMTYIILIEIPKEICASFIGEIKTTRNTYKLPTQ